MDQKFRVLKIDRATGSPDLSVTENDSVYSKEEVNYMLNSVHVETKTSGGLQLRANCWGFLGFIRFTGEYYMVLITKRSQVAMIGGHYIYRIDGTKVVSLGTAESTRFRPERHPEEDRFISILSNLDLTRSFYFSYSYDITHTLQHNISCEKETLRKGSSIRHGEDISNEMFVWNKYLLNAAAKFINNVNQWGIPIIHGFVDQSCVL